MVLGYDGSFAPLPCPGPSRCKYPSSRVVGRGGLSELPLSRASSGRGGIFDSGLVSLGLTQGILEIRPSLGLLLFRQSSAYRGDLQDTRGSIPPESQCHCCRHTLWVGQYAHRATTSTTYIEAKKKL